MESTQHLLLGIDEIWLKGANRPFYIRALKKHLKDVFSLHHGAAVKISREGAVFWVESEEPFADSLRKVLQMVPGLYLIRSVHKVALPNDKIEPLAEAIVDCLSQRKVLAGTTFRVSTRRSHKGFALSSMDISRQVGGIIARRFPDLRVQLDEPDMDVFVRIMPGFALFSLQADYGMGGLPVGTSGRVLGLLSGGFDSPVASYLMARRGCIVDHVFFHAYPFVGTEVKEKITELAAHLSLTQRHCRLWVLPFGEIQKMIAKDCRENYRTLLFRFVMVKTSEHLARQIGAQALVTGDSLGQVSSQTLENLTIINQATKLPVLRPLVGLKKNEIIDYSRKIGTHDISVRPHDDACSLFAPQHPVIRGDQCYVQQWWSTFDSEAALGSLADGEVFIWRSGQLRGQDRASNVLEKMKGQST